MLQWKYSVLYLGNLTFQSKARSCEVLIFTSWENMFWVWSLVFYSWKSVLKMSIWWCGGLPRPVCTSDIYMMLVFEATFIGSLSDCIAPNDASRDKLVWGLQGCRQAPRICSQGINVPFAWLGIAKVSSYQHKAVGNQQILHPE